MLFVVNTYFNIYKNSIFTISNFLREWYYTLYTDLLCYKRTILYSLHNIILIQKHCNRATATVL